MSIRSCICYLLMAGSLHAQELPPEIAEEWSNAIENGANENDVQRTLALLEFYLEYPLNINEADHDQLAEIAILSPSQIYAIIEHREKFGLFLTVEELQSISELDMTTLRKLRNFITAENPRSSLPLKKIIAEADHSIYLKWARILEQKEGYRGPPEENGYAGTADKIYTRYLVNYPNKIYFNFIAEKDPGEKLFNPDIPERIDYLSFSLHISRLNPFVTDLLIGDYNVSMGQGLISHNSFSTGKSTELAGLVKGGHVIKPYASVNENEMFRGLAASFQLGDRISSTVFASRVRKDANVIKTDSLTGEVRTVSSLLSGGYHRTFSEMADRDVLLEHAAGMVLKYDAANFQLGINQLLQSFDAFLELPQSMYNKFRPNGKTFTNTSVDFRYRFRNCHFFGELALTGFKNMALNQGVIFSPDRNLHLALVYRNYSKTYYSFYSNAISESSTASNESGLFLCMNYKIKRHWSLNSYLDIWRHPWLKFRVSKPSTGIEYAARLLFEQKDLLFYVKFSHESKDSDLGGEEAKYKITSRRQRSKIRFHLSNKLPGGLELRTRFELQMYSHSLRHQTGYLLFQDIIFRPIEYPLSFTARIAFFDIDSYDSRIYAYENALLNDSSISPYFQRGIRYYLNIRLKLTGHHIFEARLARTFNQNADSFSNALEMIENDRRTEVRCQLRLRF